MGLPRNIGQSVVTGASAITILVLGSISFGYTVHGILLKYPRNTHRRTVKTSNIDVDTINEITSEENVLEKPLIKKAKKSAKTILDITRHGTKSVSDEVVKLLQISERKSSLHSTVFLLSILIGYVLGVILTEQENSFTTTNNMNTSSERKGSNHKKSKMK